MPRQALSGDLALIARLFFSIFLLYSGLSIYMHERQCSTIYSYWKCSPPVETLVSSCFTSIQVLTPTLLISLKAHKSSNYGALEFQSTHHQSFAVYSREPLLHMGEVRKYNLAKRLSQGCTKRPLPGSNPQPSNVLPDGLTARPAYSVSRPLVEWYNHFIKTKQNMQGL